MCFIHVELEENQEIKIFLLTFFNLILIFRAINANYHDHNNDINSCNRIHLMYIC